MEIGIAVGNLFLTPIVGEIIERIKSILEKELSNPLKGKLLDLEIKMEDIHFKLLQVKSSRTHTNHWQQELNEVTYAAEDLLDAIEIKIEERRRAKFGQVLELFDLKLPDPNMVENIKVKLKGLTKTFNKSIEKPVADEKWTENTLPGFGVGEFIGRRDEINKIVDFLLSENINDNNSTCSIVGMGGVGKTALAQVICQDERVKEKLVVKWVHVGLKFDLEKILDKIKRDKGENSIVANLIEILKNSLGKKTPYLFVLDDLWDIRPVKWLELKRMLLKINKGNKFLITTRNQRIADKAAAKDKTVFLKPLEPAECLPLIKEFSNNKIDLLSPTIREEIIKECEGVPLAAITLGVKISDETIIEKLSQGTTSVSDIWSTEDVESEDNIMNSLKFSYDYLPPRLKNCFAYHVVCNDLHKERLTQMWTAQGFIKEPDDGDTAFEELKNASFFHDVTEDIFPGTPFKVPKLIRTLVFLVSKEYASTSESEITGVSPSTRHVSLPPEPPNQKVQEPCLSKKLRTVVGPHEIGSLSKFRGLRVLDLCGVQFESSAISFDNMKHLRYLDLSKNKNLEKLPKSLGELLFLETLRVDMCEKLKALLPNKIDKYKLTNLRHLYVSSDQDSLEFEGLSSLQTLYLKNCKKLEKLPKMSNFTELETLEILDCPRLCFQKTDLKNLKRLAIINLPRLETVPLGLVSSGQKLNSMRLSNCENLTKLPEGFRSVISLKRLTIEDCPRLKSLSTAEGRKVLPEKLIFLRINRCDELTKRCESEEGRDDVSWIKYVYLNGVLLINHIPNVEPSPSSSLDWSQIFSWLMRIITCLIFYFGSSRGIKFQQTSPPKKQPIQDSPHDNRVSS